jgi:hypothetical protein
MLWQQRRLRRPLAAQNPLTFASGLMAESKNRFIIKEGIEKGLQGAGQLRPDSASTQTAPARLVARV